jgi:uncharacterized protein
MRLPSCLSAGRPAGRPLAPSPVAALARGAVALGLAALAACSTTPPTHFHSLMPPEVGAPQAAASMPARGMAVRLEPIRLPAQVDQPQWAVQLADGSIAVLEQERWAGPLRDEFHQALLETLIVDQGMIDARTLAPAAPAAPAVSAAPAAPAAWRVAVDMRRFDSLPGREARIEGSWTIVGAGPRAAAARCDWLIREPAPGPLAALAVAHRRAIARLGASIADAVGRIRRGEAPACPAFDEPR